MGNSVSHRTITYPNGNQYEGDFRGNRRWGKGTYRWPDGMVYSGDWYDNMQDGQGQVEFPNHNIYTGQFYRNNMNGRGTLTTATGERFEGIWKFRGRADPSLIPNAYTNPVGRYEVDLIITKEGVPVKTKYNGPATVHLTTGLLVLPGMQDPTFSVYDYAVAMPVNTQGGKDDDGIAVASVAAPSTQQPQPSGGVAFGIHDQALNQSIPIRSQAVTPYDYMRTCCFVC